MGKSDGKLEVNYSRSAWVAQLVKPLPLIQVMIPGSWGGAPYWAPCSVQSLLLPLPLLFALLVVSGSLSLSLCQINKILKKKKQQP